MRDTGVSTPSVEQLAAIHAFADKYGRGWKHELMNKWLDGRDSQEPNGHLLRQVRNQCGPTWLEKFKLKESIREAIR